ncbi:phage major capsid protein [Actinoplanes sp. NPDC026623]|uniref:phage major capsid protein n=1 Tax=Actinoplanes sp. NPDC026623 TaxID=3155610 RepID=UPI0033E01650
MSPTENLDLFSAKPDQLRDLARESADEARAIVDTAATANRGLTNAEQKTFDDLMVRSTGLTSYAKDAERREGKSGPPDRGSPEVRSKFIGMGREFTDQLGLGGIPGGGYSPSQKAFRAKEWGAAVIRECSDRTGQFKSGITPSGTVVVAIPAPVAVEQGMPVAELRSLIPMTPTDGAFCYMRQDVRSNAARPVSPGTIKPESTYLFTRVDDIASTIAHVSSPLQRQDLSDSGLLQELIGNEMSFGVEQALEAQIIGGDGVGPNLLGLANTPGILTAARAGNDDYSLVRVLRTAITRLEVQGLRGSAVIMNPGDYEALESSTLTDGSLAFTAGGAQALPLDRSARRAWGIPVCSTANCPAGVAFVADLIGSTRLFLRENVVLSWTEHIWDENLHGVGVGGDLFTANLVKFRAEMRAGWAVTRPTGIVKVNLTPVP